MKDTRNHKFLGIQALRMVAALLVVFTHSTFYTFERLDKSVTVWNDGTKGVDIFFVISGFVMIYASHKLVAVADGWKQFAESRILRIVPIYWLVTTFKVFVLLLTSGFALHSRLSFVTALCSYLFLPARGLEGHIEPLVGVGWTLTFEMFFYFLFSLALFLRVNVYKFIGVILTVLALGAYYRQPTWPPVAFYLNSMVLEFFFGMMIAQACLKGIYCDKRASLWLLALGFVLLLVPTSDFHLAKAIVAGIPASLIVWSAASLGSLEEWIPRSVLYLGSASYSIYLSHSFIAPLAPTVLQRLHIMRPYLSVTLGILLGLGFGCILYQFVELPITRWLKQYRRSSREALGMAQRRMI